MVARKNPTRKPRKTARSAGIKSGISISKSQRANWSVYQHLHKQAFQAWERLKRDVYQKAAPETLIRDRDNLLLLLGECHYIAGECMRIDHDRQ